jgi:hypothetical protein
MRPAVDDAGFEVEDATSEAEPEEGLREGGFEEGDLICGQDGGDDGGEFGEGRGDGREVVAVAVLFGVGGGGEVVDFAKEDLAVHEDEVGVDFGLVDVCFNHGGGAGKLSWFWLTASRRACLEATMVRPSEETPSVGLTTRGNCRGLPFRGTSSCSAVLAVKETTPPFTSGANSRVRSFSLQMLTAVEGLVNKPIFSAAFAMAGEEVVGVSGDAVDGSLEAGQGIDNAVGEPGIRGDIAGNKLVAPF